MLEFARSSQQLDPELRASFRFLELPEAERFKHGAEAKTACGVTSLVAPIWPRCSCLPARSMLIHRPGELA